MTFFKGAAMLAALLVSAQAQAEMREVLILGKINTYRGNAFLPAGTAAGDDYTVSLLYDTNALGGTRADVNGSLFTQGSISFGGFNYAIGTTNPAQSKSVVAFQTLANGSQVIDLNFGARFGNTNATAANPRDYVHIRLTGAAGTLFNNEQSVFNFSSRPTVSVAGSYISFVVDRRGYDVRGDASAITFDEPRPAVDPLAVPEPATWAMLILGMAGIGAAVRRRPAARVRFAA